MTRPAPLITIDPGHGLPDPGCVLTAGPLLITTEAAQNLALSLTLKQQLVAAGFQVELTRADAQLPGHVTSRALAYKLRTVDMRPSVLYISVHQDIPTAGRKNGGVYWSDEPDQRRVSRALAQAIAWETHGWAMPDTTSNHGRLYIRDANTHAAVLWEAGPLKVLTKAARIRLCKPVVRCIQAAHKRGELTM